MSKLLTGNLQNRIILVFVVVLLMPAIITSIYNINRSNETLLAAAELNQLQTTAVKASAAENLMVNENADILFLSQAPEVRRYVNVSLGNDVTIPLRNVQALFQAFLGRTDIYSKACVLNPNGFETICVAFVEGEPTILESDTLSDRASEDYFTQTISLASNVTRQAPVYISKYNITQYGDVKIPIIYYATVLQSDNGTTAAVLVLEALVKPVLDLVQETSVGQTVYLVDIDGNYLLHPDETKLYGNIRGTDISLRTERPLDADDILSQREGTISGSQERPDSLQTFVRIKPPGQSTIQWTLIYEKSLEDILGSVRETAVVIVAITAASLVIAVIVAVILTRIIVRPIKLLSEAAATITNGDENLNLPQATTEDEIGVLINAFNEMVTRVNERTQELRRANAVARESARVKGEFLANVSHELRTPLNAIIGFSDMLLMGMSGELTAAQKRKMERLKDNGVRLLTLINNLLDITRIEARRIDLVHKAFSPREMTERLAQQIAILAENRQNKFTYTVASQVPETLWGDLQRLEQVIVNLLSNAFKFTENGTVTLTLEATATDWSIAVADTGIGIPPHALSLIFEEFRQVDGSSSRVFKGSGLGLAITRNLVRIMNGQIHVSSDMGKGSTFTVTLPMFNDNNALTVDEPQKVEA